MAERVLPGRSGPGTRATEGSHCRNLKSRHAATPRNPAAGRRRYDARMAPSCGGILGRAMVRGYRAGVRHRPSTPPTLTEASEYAGQETVRVSCTQLGPSYSPGQARRILEGWVDLLSGGPTAITDLQFVSRTPKRLFAALGGQPQLRRLVVKWGDYHDLTVLEPMTQLRHLELRGASAVTDLRALAHLARLETLSVEGFDRIADTSPLARLTHLADLELGGKWAAKHNGHINSIDFISALEALTTLLLHTVVVDDLDYTPLLALPRLRSVRVMAVRGMRPTHEELKSRLPWSG